MRKIQKIVQKLVEKVEIFILQVDVPTFLMASR